MPTPNQYQLFTQRRFLPFFIVQFLNALNDNVFKTSLLIFIAMTYASSSPDKANFLNNLGAGAFIFPFFIFSATAGQLADKYEKRSLIRKIKFTEILIALLVAYGFYFQHINFLLGILFLLGAQSAFFSPVKYSILPQYLTAEELMGGNGLVEMGTFVAILCGTILGGLLIGLTYGTLYLPIVVLFLALFGWLMSLAIPPSSLPIHQPQLKINWEPISQTWRTLKIAFPQRLLFASMIGISWFWFYGSLIITQIPNYTHLHLGGSPTVMTLLFTVMSVGIGIGSLSCERLSRHKEEPGLVLFGLIGLIIFTFDLSFAHGPLPKGISGLEAFLSNWHNWHILVDLFLLGLFGGIYSVPLYVILQTRSQPETRSQIIAANNILNALFMTMASAIAIFLLKAGLTIPQLYLVTALLSVAMAVYLYAREPEFGTRFRAWILSWL